MGLVGSKNTNPVQAGETLQYSSLSPYFVFVPVLTTLIGLLVHSANYIELNQALVQREWDKVQDMDRCPRAGNYFAWFSGNFNTWPFAFVSASMMGILLIALCVGYNLLVTQEHRIRPAMIFVACAILVPTNMMMTYKFMNCVLSRLCNFDSCHKFDDPKQ